MTWRPLNVNARVKVKLTPRGYQAYECHMAELGGGALSLIPRVDAEGWYEDELWSIANIFGAAMWHGCEVPFETQILVKESEP
jgi:hypothetical protein